MTLLHRELDSYLYRLARTKGIAVQSIESVDGPLDDALAISRAACDLVVVDGYDFPDIFFDTLDSLSVNYVVIDDTGDIAPMGASLILNQNPHASISLYPHRRPEHLLLGSKFAMIRSEIRFACRTAPNEAPESRPTVLVSVGGTDIGGFTNPVADSLVRAGNWDVVASSVRPTRGVIPSSPEIASHLAASTVAVVGAGSTLWEACCLGVPAVALVVADNQADGALCAARLGACITVDCREGLDPRNVAGLVRGLIDSPLTLSEISKAARVLVDGRGVIRVADSLERIRARQ